MPVYNKLVRDFIPQIIEKSGKHFHVDILQEKEYITELRKKLEEEVKEYLEADNDKNSLEELADILELIHALATMHGASIEHVEAIRKNKLEKRGGFNDRIFLKEVED